MTEEEMIEKLKEDKKIDLIEVLRIFKKEGIENFVILRNKDKLEILNLIQKKQVEIEKKDKMIDLMLQEFTDCEFELECSNCNIECERDYDQLYECNKQYFEKQVERE